MASTAEAMQLYEQRIAQCEAELRHWLHKLNKFQISSELPITALYSLRRIDGKIGFAAETLIVKWKTGEANSYDKLQVEKRKISLEAKEMQPLSKKFKTNATSYTSTFTSLSRNR